MVTKKTLLVPFLAVIALFFVAFSSALTTPAQVFTTLNSVELSQVGQTTAVVTGDTLLLRVTFTADETVSGVKIRATIDGFREDVSASTDRFDVIAGVTYTKLLSVQLPASIKELANSATLRVEIVSAVADVPVLYSLLIQREPFNFDVLAVDYNTEVASGETFPVAIVIKNVGFNSLDDGFVVVSIPELGVSARGFFGDLSPIRNCTGNCDSELVTLQKTVYLRIPENAETGVYELEVTVYNPDAVTTVKESVRVQKSNTLQIIPVQSVQDIRAGETATYELILVNSGETIRVFNIRAVSGSALDVSVPSVVTVSAGSSQTVPISVRAEDDAQGVSIFSVTVDGQQVDFTANITEGRVNTSVVALTVILAIVFIVLLVVLIILLTRREKPIKEVETSYY